MKTVLSSLVIVGCLFLGACSNDNQEGAPAPNRAFKKDVNVEEFKKLTQEEPGIILDVRTPGEVAQGTIPGAIVVDWNGSSFEEKVNKLDKTKPVYVYCKSGGRSSSACSKMEGMGFEKLYNLEGGITAWQGTGNEVVTNN